MKGFAPSSLVFFFPVVGTAYIIFICVDDNQISLARLRGYSFSPSDRELRKRFARPP